MKKHEIVEKNIGLMVLLIVVAISFGGLVEIVPCSSRRRPPNLLPV